MMAFDPKIAANTYNIEEFTAQVFPAEWAGVRARILETGVQMSQEPCAWAPRWTKIPPTVRHGGKGDGTTALKSVIFRVHDCLHQLWGLPHPRTCGEDERYYYKRAAMCGEVAVLTLTEFVYAKWLYDTFDEFRPGLLNRNAIPLLLPGGPLANKSTVEIAMRLDDILHRRADRQPEWVRDNPAAMRFVADYVPMLEGDRTTTDECWRVLTSTPGLLCNLREMPKAKFGRGMDGLELTIWMIRDFEHLLSSEPEVDLGLMHFNRERRGRIRLPENWPC